MWKINSKQPIFLFNYPTRYPESKHVSLLFVSEITQIYINIPLHCFLYHLIDFVGVALSVNIKLVNEIR